MVIKMPTIKVIWPQRRQPIQMIENIPTILRDRYLETKEKHELTWKDFLLQGNEVSTYEELEKLKLDLELTWADMLARANKTLKGGRKYESKSKSKRTKRTG